MSRRPHIIASLVSAVSLLLASNSAQAGSFFSFHFSFDNYGGYYSPYRYVYAPAYFYAWPYPYYYEWPSFYGHTHYYYPVTYAYYPSVFYRPVLPYRYPYYAYHPQLHHHWNHHTYNRYSYHYYPRAHTSTHIYGYYQPKKTYYHPSKTGHQAGQPHKTYNSYSSNRNQYVSGKSKSQREVDNEQIINRLIDRSRPEQKPGRNFAQDNSVVNHYPNSISTTDRRDSDRSGIKSEPIKYRSSRSDVHPIRDDRYDARPDLREHEQIRTTHNKLPVFADATPATTHTRQQDAARSAYSRQIKPESVNSNRFTAMRDINQFQESRRAMPERQDHAVAEAKQNPGNRDNDNRKSSMSARASISGRNGSISRNSFRGDSGPGSFRNR